MNRVPRVAAVTWLLVCGVWLGTGVGCNFLAAPALFAEVGGALPDSAAAGLLAGRIFARQMALGVGAVALLLALQAWFLVRHRGRGMGLVMALLMVGALCLAVEILYTSPAVRELRDVLGERYGSVGNSPADDPERRRFAMLHGMSMLRALVELAAGTGAFILTAWSWRREVQA